MTGASERISARQFVAAAFVSALCPLVRRFPGLLAARAGRGALLAVPLAALPMLLAVCAAYRLFRARPAGTGLAALLNELLGGFFGRLLTGLSGVWFLFYAAFALRAGAQRFLSTVYPGAAPLPFILFTALLCGAAACASLKPLARCAMLVRPLLVGLFLLIALLTAKDLDPALLLPLSAAEPVSCSSAALSLANALSVPFWFGFFGDRLSERLAPRRVLPWLAALLGVVALMTAGCLGMFGAALTARMRFPYFMLVRDLSVLGALERVEPVVIAVWVFSDFILIALLLLLSSETLRAALCPARPAGKVFRYSPALFALAAALIARALPGSDAAFRFLSETLVPALSALFGFAPLPLLLLLDGRRRRRRR